MKSKLIILSVLLGFSSLAFSQKEVRKQLRSGNKEYHQEKYTESEIAYRKALKVNKKSTDAAYNLGNSLYKQSKLPEAAEQYQATINGEKDKGKLAGAWHNTGNIFLQQAVVNRENPDPAYNENLQKSIEAYKNALRNNPKDDETRYNLALAQKLLKDNEGGGGKNDDQDKKDDQKQDQNKDQKQDQQKQDQQQQQQQQPQMSKENAQQILDAMMQDEKSTQDKVKEQQMKMQQRKRTDKEW